MKQVCHHYITAWAAAGRAADLYIYYVVLDVSFLSLFVVVFTVANMKCIFDLYKKNFNLFY
ncbi:hypothetical protein GCM10007424_07110 [Flavobacterium suaedae]|uniref:Uncharacterized protein n=1 Tax=Flavobacterium suaedae TaxID=1767027 RepID=A0ABQ1JJ69_9FLAO|nr:hypothetical protein GCM10007424_07110 [Flavobacterium suaedae]